MDFRSEHVRQAVQDFDFTRLFLEELAWDHAPANQSIPVEDRNYHLQAVAEKSGLVAYVHRSAVVPPRALRMRIERGLAKQVHEHLLIFVDDARTRQVWQWVKRQAGHTPRYREHTFHQGQTGELLVQKLQPLAFSLDEEPSIAEVTGRLAQRFDVDRITKRFYSLFKSEHRSFLTSVDGIPIEKDREWYASLMLNRLMFVYFVQKRGFLDDDRDYLRNRLKAVQQMRGQGRFLSFYRHFLRRFFHEGLGQWPEDRDPELAALIGRVPYLNGGIFDTHELERNYSQIEIPDLAFIKLFDFFDAYDWHLDEHPLQADHEINPDVLGYIFEKYVNQKQMGAYYTKEDITGYIAQNTVIPRLFDMARKDCAIAFSLDSALWRLLSEAPDLYIYPSMQRGVDLVIPPKIAAGLEDVSQRDGWNAPADDAYALPTETWRECVARHKRHFDIWEKLVDGEAQQIDELITLNLNIQRFGQDVIRYCEDPELLRAFWKAIRRISVLDPACGSGAFLFAALNVLEPLYDACLERMEAFVDELNHSGARHSSAKFSDFRGYLAEVEQHPNRRYYILKSIVIQNLYGVDIMEEAVEICKLRLFLKLAAQADTADEMEPLPDIDFNIRSGNSLVGFARYEDVEHAMTYKMDVDQSLPDIRERAKLAAKAFQRFREMQTEHGLPAQDFQPAKANLRTRLDELGKELNGYLASEYGVDRKYQAKIKAWNNAHKPFHWFLEFYGIMESGGFDVVIGNPPFVEVRNIRNQYSIDRLPLAKTRNLFAIFGSRSSILNGGNGRLGLIFPISSISTPRMLPLMSHFRDDYSRLWTSNYAVRPSKLFSGADMNLTILVASRDPSTITGIHTTGYVRWQERFRPHLFETLSFFQSSLNKQASTVPKLGSELADSVLQKIRCQLPLSQLRSTQPSSESIYYHSGGRYFRKCLDQKLSNEYKELRVPGPWKPPLISLLSSSTYYWYWIVNSDCYHVTKRDIDSFFVPEQIVRDDRIRVLSERLIEDLWSNSEIRMRSRADGTIQREVNFHVGKSKAVIDEIDTVLAAHYGFSDEELDFVMTFEDKYRGVLQKSEPGGQA